MIKLSTLVIAAAVISGSVAFSAPVKADDQLAVSICEYIAADDKNRLRDKLKSSRVNIRNIYDVMVLTCYAMRLPVMQLILVNTL